MQYNITHDVTLLVIALAFILTGALLWRKGDKLTREDMKRDNSNYWSYYADNHLGWLVCGGCALITGALLALIHVADLVYWIAAPEISALKWALRLIGG